MDGWISRLSIMKARQLDGGCLAFILAAVGTHCLPTFTVYLFGWRDEVARYAAKVATSLVFTLDIIHLFVDIPIHHALDAKSHLFLFDCSSI
ncbi:hypothetical protein IWX90DRAFT_77129 [Phyllosticta citrichinensis]|uniref:Uncharacterized protein n=1 Tax=Phyllosticta citrichinensis TaxID=1130410 RepID=A0ABR1XGU0_9PEZI